MADRHKLTTVALVRHGKTSTTGAVLPGRTPGLHLSEQGLIQANNTAQTLKRMYEGNDTNVLLEASPMERTQETAQPISEALDIPVNTNEALIEADFGEWTGQELEQLRKLPEWETVQNSPSTFRFPDGESFVEMQQRIVDGIQSLVLANEGSVIVCVSHADMIKSALANFLGMPLDSFQRLFISPCSISEIVFDRDLKPMIASMNITPGEDKKENNG